MSAVETTAATPWARGRFGGEGAARLLFGRMFEDPAIEIAAFRDHPRILAIASAGDTAIALARAGHDVTAVDVNATQISYVAERLAGGRRRSGQADGLLDAGRRVLRAAGWSRRRLDHLSAMTDCAEQVAAWRELTTGVSGAALRTLLAPAALRVRYRPEFVETADELRRDLPRRIERGLAIHPNRVNPWAQLLFTGTESDGETAAEPTGGVALCHADLADHLERVPAGSYDGFTLSNIVDGAPADYRHRLFAALRRAGSPGAVVVFRTLGPAAPRAAVAATRDRALIWGGLTISTTEELP